MSPDLSHAVWRKSTRSVNNGNCVEVAAVDGLYAIRDSKNPAGGVLIFAPESWCDFLDAAKAGQFDQS